MVANVTSAMDVSRQHQALTHKLRKPMVEKLRRDRINSSIEQLKSLLAPEFTNQQTDSKLEKADILEMTVSFLKQQKQKSGFTSSSADVRQGFSRCAHEIVHFLSGEEVKTQSQRRLLKHFQNLQPSFEESKKESVEVQLNFTDLKTISKEKSSATSTLWRPW